MIQKQCLYSTKQSHSKPLVTNRDVGSLFSLTNNGVIRSKATSMTNDPWEKRRHPDKSYDVKSEGYTGQYSNQ
jgi:hypothetical protein